MDLSKPTSHYLSSGEQLFVEELSHKTYCLPDGAYFPQAKFVISCEKINSSNGNGTAQFIIEDLTTNNTISKNGWELISINIFFNWADKGLSSIWVMDPTGRRMQAVCPERYEFRYRTASGGKLSSLEGNMTIIEKGLQWFEEISTFSSRKAYLYTHAFDTLKWNAKVLIYDGYFSEHTARIFAVDVNKEIEKRSNQLKDIEEDYQTIKDELTDLQKLLYQKEFNEYKDKIELNLIDSNFRRHYSSAINEAFTNRTTEKAIEYVDGLMKVYFEYFFKNENLRFNNVEKAYLDFRYKLIQVQMEEKKKVEEEKLIHLSNMSTTTEEESTEFLKEWHACMETFSEENKEKAVKIAMEKIAMSQGTAP